MNIKNSAVAGTLESSDISISVSPSDRSEIELTLKSSVEKQYGKQIRKVILDTLENLGVKSVVINANDKGALDCVIKARVETAILRASGEKNFCWEEDK